MTVKDGTKGSADLKALVVSDPDLVRTLVRMALQEVLEAEMTETIGAAKANQQPPGSAIERGTMAGCW